MGRAAVGADRLLRYSPIPGWAFESVCAVLDDIEPCVRAEAARVLGRSENRDAPRRLIDALEDPDRTTRLAALSALENLGQSQITAPGAAEKLAFVLRDDEDPYVASRANQTLGFQGGRRCLALRGECLRHRLDGLRDEETLWVAVNGCDNMGS